MGAVSVRERVGFGEAVHTDTGITVVPLISGAPPQERDYDLLEEALPHGRILIKEHKGGEVPTLSVSVRGERPVLLPEGEVLEGGLQTRTLNITLMLGQGRHCIPVSCVERGRWGRYREFRPARFLVDADLRRRKAASVAESLRRARTARADQGMVWEHIAFLHRRAGVVSPSEAFPDFFAARGEDLEKAVRSISHPLPGQVGAVVLYKGCLLGMDLFDYPGTWALLASKVLGGYAVSALWSAASGPRMTAEAFLVVLEQTPTEAVPAPAGRGWHHLFSGALTGFALEEGGRIRHLFAAPAPEQAPGRRGDAIRIPGGGMAQDLGSPLF
ncbi:hypothetical protein HRbin23_01256 [bacterium HR23]|nr:hypothetical protein HRbin23_01256 [bacterium HR23]